MTTTDGFDASDEDATTRALQERYAARAGSGGVFVGLFFMALLALAGLFVWSRADTDTFVFVGLLMTAAGLIGAFRAIGRATAH
ncbi:MAG: hypothetical protein KDG89_12360 [Geminicoccaceae bacterium]|nr:hypothetical protein [Geminicoccaceae bacterium]